MLCLVDTNVLLRGLDRNHPNCRTVRRAIIALRRDGAELCIAAQNLVEFWAVATRPVDANGLGMSPSWAAAQLVRMRRLFTVLAENADVQPEWERLVIQHDVSGKKVHDARLVATMNVHTVSHILTFNTGDFERYPAVITVRPETAASAEKPPGRP
jgi:predicted nucleic acid-binding protein